MIPMRPIGKPLVNTSSRFYIYSARGKVRPLDTTGPTPAPRMCTTAGRPTARHTTLPRHTGVPLFFSPLSNHLWACLLVYSPFPFFAAADNDGGSNGNDMLWGKDDILWWWCGGVVGGGGSTGGGIVVVAVGGVEVKAVW